jgi:hypothetical protein
VAVRLPGIPKAWLRLPTCVTNELFGPISNFEGINLDRLINVPQATKAEVDETILFG